VLVLALTLAASACGKSEAKLEAEQIVAAIGRMRDAPRAERAPLIEALAALEPKGEQAKEAQRRCLEAYRGLEAAHHELDEVQASVTKAKTEGSDADPSLLGKLLTAEEKLTQARADQAGCASAVMALQRSLR